MNLSLSFLGTEARQLPPPGVYGNDGVEAVLLNHGHLEADDWETAWENVQAASDMYGPENVTFHFPMNGSDYVEEKFVEGRLLEGYKRAGALGIAGVIVHSNRLRDVAEWRRFDVADEQTRVLELLSRVASAGNNGTTWLGLENMPIVGNFGYETDPLFSKAKDFSDMPPNVGVVWDVCHATSSEQYITDLKFGLLPRKLIARSAEKSDFDPAKVAADIVHWHFAAFGTLNNPNLGTDCEEGLLPSEIPASSGVFEDALCHILELSGGTEAINFEVQEADYTSRERGPEIISWAKEIIATL
ncbi:MAG: TIM barrel protein [Candidatus Saccharimonadales bacterium]